MTLTCPAPGSARWDRRLTLRAMPLVRAIALGLARAVARDGFDQLPHRLVGPEFGVGLDAFVAFGAHFGLDPLALAEAVPELLDLVDAHRNHAEDFTKKTGPYRARFGSSGGELLRLRAARGG